MNDALPLPFGTADFLFAPKKLPDPETDLDTFLEQCNKEINQMICRAWDRGALPQRTALVQVLTKPPITGQVDFRHPFILKKLQLPDADRLRLIASFAHTTWHLMHRKASSHARMRERGDTSRGAMVIFTKDKPLKAWPPGLGHILHLGYERTAWKHPLDISDCKDELARPEFCSGYDLGEFSQKFETFDVVQFLQYAQKHKHKFSSIIKDQSAPSDWNGYPSIAKNADPNKKHAVEENLFTDIVGDKSYRDRVAVLLHCGAIVLCAPQSFFIEGHLEKNVIFDSGLTVILTGDEAPTPEDLAMINAVAHSISSFIASTYGLANKLAHESQMIASRNIVSMISHSLKGSLTKASISNHQLERLVRLEMIKLDAASILFDPTVAKKKAIKWSDGGFEGESLAATMREGIFESSKAITFTSTDLNGKSIDARFAALLIELSHNLRRHSRSGEILITRVKASTNRFDIFVSGAASDEDVQTLLNHLESNNVLAKGQSLRGWNFILMLAHALAENNSACLEIVFNMTQERPALRIGGVCGARHIRIHSETKINPLPERMQMIARFNSLIVQT